MRYEFIWHLSRLWGLLYFPTGAWAGLPRLRNVPISGRLLLDSRLMFRNWHILPPERGYRRRVTKWRCQEKEAIIYCIDDAKCFHTVRELRWSDGVRCAHWILWSPYQYDGRVLVFIAFPVTSSSWYLSGIITKLSWVLRVRPKRETVRRKTFAVPASAIPQRPTWNPITA